MASVPRWMRRCQGSLFILYCMMLCLLYLYQHDYFSQPDSQVALPSRDYRIHPGGPSQEKDGEGNVFKGAPSQHRRVGILAQHGVKSDLNDSVASTYLYTSRRRRRFKKKRIVVELQEPCFKQVQIWTQDFHLTKGRTDFPCPGLPCSLRLIEDTRFETMETSDAVFFHYLSTWDWAEMHKHKKLGQKWIFYSAQSPVQTQRNIIPPVKYHNNSYDYIMSYRRYERNLFGDFGKVTEMEKFSQNSTNWAEGKDKLAVWIEQECSDSYRKWERLTFVQELAKLIPVDIYGPCGRTPQCNTENCKKDIERHKFYLALEDCNCRNFITKAWDAFQNNLVPVVYGPPKEDYDLVLPPGSFIHVQQFSTLKELANYLRHLDSHDDIYNKFFDWKKRWRVESIPENHLLEPAMMCQVVERLLDDDRSVRYGKYRRMAAPNWDQWWMGSCDNSSPFPIDMV